MQFSEQTDQLFTDFVAARSKFPAIVKDKKVTVATQKGRYTYNYADLGTILSAVEPILALHKLAVTQTVECTPRTVAVTTALIHASGQWMMASSEWELAAGASPQVIGSAITYSRRYGVAAILNIATEEDDDAALASDIPSTIVPKEVRLKMDHTPIGRYPKVEADALEKLRLTAEDMGEGHSQDLHNHWWALAKELYGDDAGMMAEELKTKHRVTHFAELNDGQLRVDIQRMERL